MIYIIIEASNFADIEKQQNATKERINEAHKTDVFLNYAQIEFAVIGDAVKMFCDKYGVSFADQDTIKTDGKTKAEIIPFITPSWYYDARINKCGFIHISPHHNIGYLVKYNGVLLGHYKKHYNSESVAFTLFNDDTDYGKYLPSNWDDENQKPNYTGVLTDKKLDSWVNWLTMRKNAATAAKNAAENKVIAFLKKVRSYDATGANTCVIGENRGYIIKNGLRYEYEINSTGYISEKVSIDYTFVCSEVDTLTKFDLLTKGKFVK